jgi:cytochrome P450
LDEAGSRAKYLPEYLPKDAAIFMDYEEAFEALRHVKMRNEPTHESHVSIMGGTVSTLYGSEHVFRRRIMNRMVRPDALERYRREITMPTLLRRLRQLQDTPDSDGIHRTDLVKLSKRMFVEFATTLVGIDPPTEEDGAELEELVNGLHLGLHSKFLMGEAFKNRQSDATRGNESMGALGERFLDPAFDQCPVSPVAGDGPSLIAILAVGEDPAWKHREIALREAALFILAAVDSTTNLLTYSVDELHRWLTTHPEDAPRTQDLEFLGRVVQEALRLHTLPNLTRQASEDIQLETTGRVIKKGQWIAAIIPVINRDPKVFGASAAEFNPHREVPPTRPRYGLAFGAGQHQCIGLRVVLGNDGIGTHADVLKTLLAAGVRPDPERTPQMEPNTKRNSFTSYPVIFSNLQAVT